MGRTRRLGQELRDPWTAVAGGLAGGLAWAVAGAAAGPVGIAAAAGVGLAVAAAKVLTATLLGGDEPEQPGTAPGLPIRPGSVAAAWVSRAERAAAAFRDLARSVGPGPVGATAQSMGADLETTLQALRRLGGQACAVEDALARLDSRALAAEEARLARAVGTGGSGGAAVLAEEQRSLQSVRAQQAVLVRLSEARSTLLAQLQSGAIGLEALVASLSEVATQVSATGTDGAAGRVDDLTAQLDGLRAGLAETETVSRRALAAYDANPDTPDRVPDPGSGLSSPPAQVTALPLPADLAGGSPRAVRRAGTGGEGPAQEGHR